MRPSHFTYQVAWLAVQTGISPQELLALDEPLFRAVRAVAREKAGIK